jgi:hypothetical protein
MPAWGYLCTIFTGTVDTVGKLFTHALGTTPDMVFVQPETIVVGTTNFAVTAFGTQTCTLTGPVDGAAVRVLVQRLHTILG